MKILTDSELEILKNKIKQEAIEEYIVSHKNIEREIYNRNNCSMWFKLDDPNIIVFSVERVNHNKLNEKTIIGYYLKAAVNQNNAGENKVINEWNLFCSREQHNELLKKFATPKSKSLLKG